MEDYSLFMQRALELAEYGRGQVAPNPMVGCVIVNNGRIIGEGFHQIYGGPHAEVNAINDVFDKSLLSDSTLFVTLEPCSHWGKTPPCADLIVKNNIKKVVICNADSNPLVGGKGIEKLREAGIEVMTGVLEERGRDLNRRFFTFIEKQRPFIILKWAQTSDGFIAREDYTSKWITNKFSRKLNHKWRTEEAAIMVGTNTAQFDDPQLNVRDWVGLDPIRIVLDRGLTLPHSLRLFDKNQMTLCYNSKLEKNGDNLKYIKLDYTSPIIPQIIENLYNRKIQSVIVEGGSFLLNSLIEIGIWDEIRCFESKSLFKKGIKAPLFEGILEEEEILKEGDIVKIFIPKP